MTRFQDRFSAIAIVFALAAVSQADFLEWSFKDRRPGGLKSGVFVSLQNLTLKQSLRYGRRNFGINLEWDKSPLLSNVQVVHNGADFQPILYTELVSIAVKNGGYLKYEKRSTGINLVWSAKPVYQWQIGGDGGDPGQPIRSGDALCLYNTAARDFLIYDTRRFGINLVWAKDKGTKSWTDLMNDTLKKLGSPSTKMSNWISGLGK